MNLNKSTRYGLYAAMELAKAWPEGPVTVAQIAARYGVPETALAKVLQQLVRSRLANGTRGVRGGYRLAKSPAEMTVFDVLAALEPVREVRQCLLDDYAGECDEYETCRLRRLFDEVDELARATFSSTTLETLIGGSAQSAGGERSGALPLSS